MKIEIENGKKSPAYLQLYRKICEDIVAGVYPKGAKLPSKRNMAGELGVSTVTVEHAYALLADEGYIEPKEKSGYFVIFSNGELYSPGAPKRKLIKEQKDNGFDEKSVFPISVLAKTMRSVISEYREKILEKGENSGRIELREAIADYLRRARGMSATAEQIVIGSGSEYLYSLVVELLGRSRRYAIESPSYNKIEEVYRAKEIEPMRLPLCEDGIESEALWNSNADVLHISPYRSYPSGVSASASKRHEYLRWARKGKIIIEDDFESEFSVSKKTEETLFSHTENENVIYMNSFSKTISAALRVAYMVLPKGLMKEFSARLGFYSCTVPSFEQILISELIANGDFERHINRVRRSNRNKLKQLAGL